MGVRTELLQGISDKQRSRLRQVEAELRPALLLGSERGHVGSGLDPGGVDDRGTAAGGEDHDLSALDGGPGIGNRVGDPGH